MLSATVPLEPLFTTQLDDNQLSTPMNERKALGIKQGQHSTWMHERMNYILCKHAINPEVFVHSFQE